MLARSLLVVGTFVVGSTAALCADDSAAPAFAIPTGAGAQVWSTSFPVMIRGNVVKTDATALYLAPDDRGPIVIVPFTTIETLDLALDKKRNALKGAFVGAIVVGVAYGLGAKVDSSPRCNASSTNRCSRGESLAGGALAGAGLGAIAGFFIKTDRWTGVDPRALRPPRATMSRESAALTVGFAFRF